MTSILNCFYALMFIEAGMCAFFLPTLLLVSMVPKRLPTIRQRLLVWTFAGTLLIPVFAPKITAEIENYVQQTRATHAGAAVSTPASSAKMANASLAPIHVRFSPEFTEAITPAVKTFGVLRDAGFTWLILCYGLSIVLIWKSRPSATISGARISKFTSTPVTAWFGKHYIILPEGAEGWPTERISRVMAHEQAHVNRRDWVSQLLANFVVALSGFNPAVWACARKLRHEAEHAADQQVLMTESSPTEYANDLLQIAKSARYDRNVAVLAMASKGSLKSRIKFVLNANHPRGTSRLAVVASGFAGLTLPAAAHVSLIVSGIAGLPVNADQALASQSRNPDMRKGLAVAGTAENGWTGQFADGTTAKFCGIWYGTKSGAVFVTPDGEPGTAPCKSADWEKGHPGYMDIVFALPADKVSPAQECGTDSPSMQTNNEPKGETYAGGYLSTSADGKTSYSHNFHEVSDPAATQFSIGLDFSSKDVKVTPLSLPDILVGKVQETPEGLVFLGHPTNAEKECLREVGLPKEDFGLRIELPTDSVETYRITLSDNPSDTTEQSSDRGCGGQEDATPGYQASQEWYKPEFRTKKYVVIQWMRNYQTDFVAIPIRYPKEGP
ncbi:MAG TPA: M56 family metallopeptidase [Fimbriimonadaceae bacterium]|jgi:beta-lactamase regulating signal transducer with metallopeptidase domain